MLSSNGNPFLRAEYLNPPPATNTMDSKKSPLALLAQTCSQIGADATTATKTTTTTTTDQRKKTESLTNDFKSTTNGEANNNRRPSSSGTESIQPAAKTNKKTTPNEPCNNNNRLTPTDRRSKSSSPKNRFNVAGGNTMDQPTASASTAFTSHPLLQPSPQQQQQLGSGSSHQHASQHLMMAATNDPSCSSASAMSLANSYKSLMASAYPASASPYAPYEGLRHPSMVYGAPHPSALDFGAYALNAAAVAKSSSTSLSSSNSGNNPFLPSTSNAAMMNGYLASHPAAYSVAALQQAMHHQQHYGNAAANRLNSATAKAADPCRDPYCTACPATSTTTTSASTAGQQIHMVCTTGCGLTVQCDHVKVPIAAHHLQMMSASSPSAAAPPSSPHRPYICNWIVADNYCGKRFTSSDDLLQHLRTHTNLSSTAAPDAPFAHPSSIIRAAYPTPPLSPLSAARYHPYGKTNPSTGVNTPAQHQAALFHPGMAAAMAAMAGPYGPAGQSAAHLFHPALAPYYSHLSLFAAHHQANNQTRQVPGAAAPLGGAGLGGQP